MFTNGNAATHLESNIKCMPGQRCAACLMVDELIEQLVRKKIREEAALRRAFERDLQSPKRSGKVVPIWKKPSVEAPEAGAAIHPRIDACAVAYSAPLLLQPPDCGSTRRPRSIPACGISGG
jgi:hypothetical protein